MHSVHVVLTTITILCKSILQMSMHEWDSKDLKIVVNLKGVLNYTTNLNKMLTIPANKNVLLMFL